jgi:hypothetical protein
MSTFKNGSLNVESDSDVFDDDLHAVCDVMLHELLTDVLRLILLNQNKSNAIITKP